MTTARRVLVTGGGGFVGSHLAEGLAGLGWQVTALDRAFDELTRSRLATTTLVEADLTDGVPGNLPLFELVVHAAAITTEAGELGWTRAAHVAANVSPLAAAIDFARRRPPGTFVFVSSSGVFAPTDGVEYLSDVDLPTSRTPYAVAKQLGEAMTDAALDGVCAAHVVRLGYVYGEYEVARHSRTRLSAVAQWLAAARAGQPLEIRADDPCRDWTFAPDLAPALVGLIEAPARRRAVHLASPHLLNDSALARLVAGHFVGSRCVTVEARAAVKPPMRASDLGALRTFPWTDPASAIARLITIRGRV